MQRGFPLCAVYTSNEIMKFLKIAKRVVICVLIGALIITIYKMYSLHKIRINDENIYASLQSEGSSVIKKENQYYHYEYDFEALAQENSDVRGWIKIPSTQIDFPVCQGDNNDYYLNHSFNNVYSSYGCPFLDFRSNCEDTNRVIHGHNMGRGKTTMFSTLVYYENQEFFDEHKLIHFAEPNRDTQVYEIFGVFNFDVNKLSQFDYMQRNFNDFEFTSWIEYIKSHSIYDIGITPKLTDKILTLSTCNREFGANNRLLVFAVKIE